MILTDREFDISDALYLIGNSSENITNPITSKALGIIKQLGESRSWFSGTELVGCGGKVIYEKDKCEAWSIIRKE